MKRRARPIFSGLVLLSMAACGGAPAPQDEAEAKARGRDTDKTVFDDLIQTQDKARAVEDVTMASKAANDAAIEQAEGGSQDQKQ